LIFWFIIGRRVGAVWLNSTSYQSNMADGAQIGNG